MLLIIIGIFFIVAFTSFVYSSQDFDGLFTMDVPLGKHYEDQSYCYQNKPLGCAKQYVDANDENCIIDEDEFAVYYYDDSLVFGSESNVAEHSVHVLTTTFLYEFYGEDGNLLILENQVEGMQNLPLYVVGAINDDGSKVVFVGGYDLNKLKNYAKSVKFE